MYQRKNQVKQVWFNGSKYSVPEFASYICEDLHCEVTWHEDKPIPEKITGCWVSGKRLGKADLIHQVTWDRQIKPIGDRSRENPVK